MKIIYKANFIRVVKSYMVNCYTTYHVIMGNNIAKIIVLKKQCHHGKACNKVVYTQGIPKATTKNISYFKCLRQ